MEGSLGLYEISGSKKLLNLVGVFCFGCGSSFIILSTSLLSESLSNSISSSFSWSNSNALIGLGSIFSILTIYSLATNLSIVYEAFSDAFGSLSILPLGLLFGLILDNLTSIPLPPDRSSELLKGGKVSLSPSLLLSIESLCSPRDSLCGALPTRSSPYFFLIAYNFSVSNSVF